MSVEAFLTMPITYQGLVVESTTRCNAKCGMCYQAAGPQGSDIIGKGVLEEETIARVIREVAEIPEVAERFHLAGGEAFLKIDTCIRLYAIARESGYVEISSTSNAYWAKRMGEARDVADQARAAGLRRLEISWDYWHSPYIHPGAINNCLVACHEAGINTNLRLLTTKSHSSGEALAMLDAAALDCASEISSCPVFPTGRAITTIDADDIYHSGNLSSTCDSVLHLTVNGQGNIAPCCAGADQTDGLIFGNVRDRPVGDIVREMNASPMLRALVFLGPGTLLGILEEKGLEAKRDFASICHLCWTVASNADHMKILKNYFEEAEQNPVETILDRHFGDLAHRH